MKLDRTVGWIIVSPQRSAAIGPFTWDCDAEAYAKRVGLSDYRVICLLCAVESKVSA